MMQDVRPLTDTEKQLLAPEVQALMAGLQAQDRLQRMIALLGSELNIEGLELDLQRGMLVKPAPEPEPQPA